MAILRGYAESRRRTAPTVVESNQGMSLLSALGLGFSKAGPFVDQDAALSVSTVYACTHLIAGTIGTLPLHTYAKAGGGRVKVELPSERVVWDRPNPEVSRSIFWETAIGHCVITGNSFLYVVPVPGTRQPAELWPIEPRRVRVERRAGRKAYIIDGQVELTDWTAGGEIVHVQGFGTDGMVGLSPIALARQAIGVALGAEESSASLFKSGGIPSGVLSTDQPINPEQAKEIQDRWEEAHGGAARKTAVLGRGTKWSPTVLNPDDAQMLETRRFQVNEIARWFRVPPEMVGGAVDGGSLTYANVQERILHLVQFTLMPWLVRFEQTISDELLRPSSHYAKFDLRGLLRGTPEQRAAYYQALTAIRAMTPDEVRELEEFAPLSDEQKAQLAPPAPVPAAEAAA